MKAKEAPEKIYVTLDEIDDLALDKRFDYPICTEYTRTDTFIEKACEWLKENKDHPFIGCEDPYLSGYLTDEFIEAFKKEMEK